MFALCAGTAATALQSPRHYYQIVDPPCFPGEPLRPQDCRPHQL